MYRYTRRAHRGPYKHVTEKTSRESGDQRCRVQTGFGVSQETRVKTPNRALIISCLSFIPDSLDRSVSPSLSFSFCYCLWDAGVKNHIFPTVLPEVLLADTQRKDASSFYIALILSFLLLSPLFFYSVSLWCSCHRGQVYMRADLARYCQLVNHNEKNNGANSNCCVVWRPTKDKEKGVKKWKISGTCADCSGASWFLNVWRTARCVCVCEWECSV